MQVTASPQTQLPEEHSPETEGHEEPNQPPHERSVRAIHPDHPDLYAWRASLLSVIGRAATQLDGDPELDQARVEVLAVLDRRIAHLEDRCPGCGASELCECEVSLT